MDITKNNKLIENNKIIGEIIGIVTLDFYINITLPESISKKELIDNWFDGNIKDDNKEYVVYIKLFEPRWNDKLLCKTDLISMPLNKLIKKES